MLDFIINNDQHAYSPIVVYHSEPLDVSCSIFYYIELWIRIYRIHMVLPPGSGSVSGSILPKTLKRDLDPHSWFYLCQTSRVVPDIRPFFISGIRPGIRLGGYPVKL